MMWNSIVSKITPAIPISKAKEEEAFSSSNKTKIIAAFIKQPPYTGTVSDITCEL